MFATITKIWTVFQVAFGVLKEVKELVEIFEEADTNDGAKHGPEKKNAIVELVEAVYDAADNTIDLPFKKETIMGLVDKAIDVIVDLMNVVGQFRSKSKK